MRTYPSQTKKRAAYFLSIMSNITLIVSIIMFFVCIIQGIPLKYMTGFILVYAITAIPAVILTERGGKKMLTTETKKSLALLYIMSNIAGIGTILVLIKRYELQEYLMPIIFISLVIINLTVIEFHMQTFSKLFSTKGGSWTLRTILLLLISGGSIYAYNSLTQSPINITITGTPKKTSSETTGTISTVDTVPEEIRSIEIETAPPQESTKTAEIQASTAVESYKKTEAIGTITTEGNKNITIDSIESVDGSMSAKIQDGQIVVEVIPTAQDTDTSSDASSTTKSVWTIEGVTNNIKGGGGLQGVVISAPKSSIPPGSYSAYQNIQLSAEGASAIFFTIDGTTPTCTGRGLNNIATVEKNITIKAISCFGGNKIRGPVSVFTYSIE